MLFRSQQDALVLSLEKAGEFGDRGCLARTVDAADEDEREFAFMRLQVARAKLKAIEEPLYQ